MTAPITITPQTARRLAVAKQRLSGKRPSPNANGIMTIARDLRCLQIDPISAVARTQHIVLFSRLGNYKVSQLDRVMWQDRALFEYWGHAYSLVLTEDYALHNLLMRQYATPSALAERTRSWLAKNEKLRRHILSQLKRNGPMLSRDLTGEGLKPSGWVSSGWTSDRNVSRMLDILLTQGKIMVAGRSGIQKLYDLSERCLPDWTPREKLREEDVVLSAAQHSLRALGVAPANQISQHFTRGRYPNLSAALKKLEAQKKVVPVQITDNSTTYAGKWYAHADDVPLIERLGKDGQAWLQSARTVLLSPFDNLICDRRRTQLLFNFHFRIEIYVPKHLRRFGYYVLPILHGDSIIGRVDPLFDRESGRLAINAVYAEPGAPAQAGEAVAQAIVELGDWLGADGIDISRRVPRIWESALT